MVQADENVVRVCPFGEVDIDAVPFRSQMVMTIFRVASQNLTIYRF